METTTNGKAKDIDYTIRPEQPQDYWETDRMVRLAFQDMPMSGGDEHLVNHNLRLSPSFVPQLNFVAASSQGDIIGNIIYSEATLKNTGGQEHTILTFGPLSVLPAFQRQGIGSALLQHSLRIAKQTDYPAILIYGHPEYYPRFGFVPARQYGIIGFDGQAPDAMMVLELQEGALNHLSGSLRLDPAYFPTREEVAEFEKTIIAER